MSFMDDLENEVSEAYRDRTVQDGKTRCAIKTVGGIVLLGVTLPGFDNSYANALMGILNAGIFATGVYLVYKGIKGYHSLIDQLHK